MIKVKAKQQPVRAEQPSLADRIKAVCAEAEALIQRRVDELKASHEGKLLPRDWLEQDLRKRLGGACQCRVALRLLEDE